MKRQKGINTRRFMTRLQVEASVGDQQQNKEK
jgi:hypothetical protein